MFGWMLVAAIIGQLLVFVVLVRGAIARRCHLCRHDMRGNNDGHGLGECVGICDRCSGAGCRQCWWTGTGDWGISYHHPHPILIAPGPVMNMRQVRVLFPMSKRRQLWLMLTTPLERF